MFGMGVRLAHPHLAPVEPGANHGARRLTPAAPSFVAVPRHGSDAAMTRAVLRIAVCLVWSVATWAAEPPRCPPTAAGEAHLRAPVGWTAAPIAAVHPFERIELFAGPMGEQAKDAPASLAPDDERRSGRRLTQVWRVGGETGGVVLVCRYRGTPASLTISLPAGVATCEQTLGWDAKRGVIDEPGAPPTMRCTTGRPAGASEPDAR